MSNPLRWLVMLVVVLGLAAVRPGCVFACSCVPPGSPAEERAASAAVFSGKVVDVDVPGGTITNSADPVKVTLEVLRVWKGPAQPTLVVTTARDSASCGFNFTQGQEYLVYARGTATDLSASLCSRTRLLSEGAEDMAALGEGTRPRANTSGNPETPSNLPQAGTPDVAAQTRSYLLPVFGFGAVGLVLALGVALRIRRHRA